MASPETISETPFFIELVDQLRQVRFDALPKVVAALREASDASAAARSDSDARGSAAASPARNATGQSAGATPSQSSADDLAREILRLPSKGSKIDAVQRAVVVHALAVSHGNVSAAARLLGVDRKALERKVARYGVKR